MKQKISKLDLARKVGDYILYEARRKAEAEGIKIEIKTEHLLSGYKHLLSGYEITITIPYT